MNRDDESGSEVHQHFRSLIIITPFTINDEGLGPASLTAAASGSASGCENPGAFRLLSLCCLICFPITLLFIGERDTRGLVAGTWGCGPCGAHLLIFY